MLASLSFLLGILIGGVVLAVSRRQKDMVRKPALLRRASFAFGLVAVSALGTAMWLTSGGHESGPLLWNMSISLGFASVMTGIAAIVKKDRSWPAWAGFIAGLAVALFWLAFAAGNILGLGE